MPLDELLALYGYEASDPVSEQESEGSDTTARLPDMTLDKVSGRGQGWEGRSEQPRAGAGGGQRGDQPGGGGGGGSALWVPTGQGTVGRASSPQGKTTCSVGRAGTLVPSPQGSQGPLAGARCPVPGLSVGEREGWPRRAGVRSGPAVSVTVFAPLL